MNEQKTVFEKEVIKLSRNSKGYTWEIRVVSLTEKITDDDLKHMDCINKKMEEDYGSQ